MAEATHLALIRRSPTLPTVPQGAPLDPQLWGELLPRGQAAASRLPGYLQALRDLVEAGLPLAHHAAHYLHEAAVGQSPHTLAAKCRDLVAFIRWYVQLNQHAESALWMPRDTRRYLLHLQQGGRAPPTINRALATLRHFARWLHEQPGALFMRSGLPTRGVGELHTTEGDSKKIDPRQMHALFKAADNLVTLASHCRARPRRNRALLGVLYYTGLRVQELCHLAKDQLRGHHLVDVTRKGRVRSRGIYLVAEARRCLDDYLEHERPLDDPQGCGVPLFLSPQSGGGLQRRDVARALCGIADEANKRRDEPIHLHPHRLRHTFGSLFRAKSQSDSETAVALGHCSLKYVGRYTRQTEQERQARLDDLFAEVP